MAAMRTITGFRQDDEGDWVAELACLHSQHMRHNPPMVSRPWVLDPAGRQARIGRAVSCPLCDRAELPAGLVLLRTAGPFDQDAIPAGLCRPHRTASGTWGVLRVLSGTTGFRLDGAPPRDLMLAAGQAQPIPPGVEHQVEPAGPVRLVLEFWGASS
jgi:tellurite methyltransferase